MRRRSLWLVGGLAAMVACRASVEADAHVGGQAEPASFDEPLSQSERAAQATGGEEAPAEPALLGARHDLTLAGETLQPNCSCLAVAVGYPNNPSFFWSSMAPTIDADRQLVIAFSSQGIACPGQEQGSLGASYWGYRVVNGDVVVLVERAESGRPLTTGAIIPKPDAGGVVYVEPASKKVPYGMPLDGSGKRCRVEPMVATQRVVPPPPHTQLPAATPARP